MERMERESVGSSWEFLFSLEIFLSGWWWWWWWCFVDGAKHAYMQRELYQEERGLASEPAVHDEGVSLFSGAPELT